MQVTVSRQDLEQFISEQVGAGHYPSPQAAVEAAVERLMFEHELERPTEEDLRGIELAQESIDRGDYVELGAFAAAMRRKYCAQ
jgi:Arc/MetJ-type ribon-helix-helix transcriptional regulator